MTTRVKIIGSVVVVIAAALVITHIRADRFKNRIQFALEASLHRKVEILGPVHLNLFTGPGFSAEEVSIEEDPRAGVEPFVHMDSLEATVRLTSLLAGHLAFSTVKMIGPNINLVKPPTGAWNVQPFLSAAGLPGVSDSHADQHASAPDIEIRDGRLNFKFGDTKSSLYITNADVDVYPNSSGDLVLRFSGEPARTDRSAQGFGRISARGLLHATPGKEEELSMGVHLERTSLSDLTQFFNANDIVHGFAAANVHLAGPLSNLALTGDASVEDVHRWDLLPMQGPAWKLNWHGKLDVRGQQLEIATIDSAEPPAPLAAKLRVTNFLGDAKWEASATVRDLPAATLVDMAQHMGAALPKGLEIGGKADGTIAYLQNGGIQGQLAIQNASFKFPGAGEAQLPTASLNLSEGNVSLAPAELQLASGHAAQVEARYAVATGAVWLKVSTQEMTIAELGTGPAHIFMEGPIPIFETCRQGTWNGWIAFASQAEGPGQWSGDFQIQNTAMELPGFSDGLRLAWLPITIDAGRVAANHFRGHAGKTNFEGDYIYNQSAPRPEHLRLSITELDASELEHLFKPSLDRQESFLARAFGRQAAIPGWLRARSLEGTVQVKDLRYAGVPLGSARAKLQWDGPIFELVNFDTRLGKLQSSGRLVANLTGGLPKYRLHGRIFGLDYHDGKLNVEGDLDSSGMGVDLLANALGEGSFNGSALQLSPEAAVDTISGTYRLRPGSRLTFPTVQAMQGDESFAGQGTLQPDGKVILDLADGKRQLRVISTLISERPDVAAR